MGASVSLVRLIAFVGFILLLGGFALKTQEAGLPGAFRFFLFACPLGSTAGLFAAWVARRSGGPLGS